MNERTGTQHGLIQDLMEKPESTSQATIMFRAKKGMYHDFKTWIATPKVALVLDLTDAGLEDLAQKARDGYYDDPVPKSAAAVDFGFGDIQLVKEGGD